MTWHFYRLVFRLESPVYIGRGKVGNIQQTYTFVHGRALWGALTARLARDYPHLGGYEAVGARVHHDLVYSYFFPAVQNPGADFDIYFPKDVRLNQRILYSFCSTARDPERFSAEEASLHEFELLSSKTRDTGAQVFLVGYLGARSDSPLPWKKCLPRLQFGGDRRYGWGRVGIMAETVEQPLETPINWFNDYRVEENSGEDVFLRLMNGDRLLAHTSITVPSKGQAGPLVGRLWRNQSRTGKILGAGQQVDYQGLFWEPGSLSCAETLIKIGNYGLWEPVSTD